MGRGGGAGADTLQKVRRRVKKRRKAVKKHLKSAAVCGILLYS